jgi:RND family efflux transporter MFP subunit
MTDDHETGSKENNTVVSSILSAEESWSRLKDSYDPKTFTAAWLEIQSRLIGADARCGVVVYGIPDQGPFEPTAVWPVGSLGTPVLVEAIESAINKRLAVVKNSKRMSAERSPNSHVVACPLLVDSQICGAVAFEVEHVSDTRLQQILEQLEWGVGWLEVNVHRNKYTSSDRLDTVLELIATSLHHDRFQEAATAVATELAGILGCERVSIGFLRGKHSQLRALSHSATFGKKGNLIRSIEATMDEAIDQHATVVFPVPEEGTLQVTRAHAELAKRQGDGSVCTIPLNEGERLLGAMVLERPAGEPFDERTIRLCEHTASLLGPLLDVKRKDDRWLISKAADSGVSLLKKLLGPRHVALKLGVLTTLSLLLFFIFTEGDYRVTADARLEGTVQRAVAVSIAGYVVEANVRAGDIVKTGDILFSIDDRDLRLERLKWTSQKLQSSREYSEATADHDRAKARILSAQIEQAEAEIALLDEELKRTRVRSPFDGFVLSGDLSQSLGSPVERGDILFELAPLDSYRVILEVDERDIDDVAVNQIGQLALSSAPEQALPITVEKITPLSTAEEGQNYFRVEARLDGNISPRLRPGMEGVGKINIERRKLIWIWTYKITHWVRMFFWSWWP